MKHVHCDVLKAYLEDRSCPIYKLRDGQIRWEEVSEKGLQTLFETPAGCCIPYIYHIGLNPPRMIIVNKVRVEAGINMSQFAALPNDTNLWYIGDIASEKPSTELKMHLSFAYVSSGLVFYNEENAQKMLDAIMQPLKTQE